MKIISNRIDKAISEMCDKTEEEIQKITREIPPEIKRLAQKGIESQIKAEKIQKELEKLGFQLNLNEGWNSKRGVIFTPAYQYGTLNKKTFHKKAKEIIEKNEQRNKKIKLGPKMIEDYMIKMIQGGKELENILNTLSVDLKKILNN